MGDSELSASELRQRYQAGGSLNDSELTASQLRARHGIASNSKGKAKIYNITYKFDKLIFYFHSSDFSTRHGSSESPLTIIILVVLAIIAAAIFYFVINK